MDIQLDRTDADHAILRLRGELTLVSSNPARVKIMEALETGVRHITVDLEHVPFIDSAGLGMLIGVRQTTRSRGGEFKLVGVNPQIYPLFQITRLDVIFGISN
jgi:anti-anti-sigma factor